VFAVSLQPPSAPTQQRLVATRQRSRCECVSVYAERACASHRPAARCVHFLLAASFSLLTTTPGLVRTSEEASRSSSLSSLSPCFSLLQPHSSALSPRARQLEGPAVRRQFRRPSLQGQLLQVVFLHSPRVHCPGSFSLLVLCVHTHTAARTHARMPMSFRPEAPRIGRPGRTGAGRPEHTPPWNSPEFGQSRSSLLLLCVHKHTEQFARPYGRPFGQNGRATPASSTPRKRLILSA
jgi:hypothetical protein